MSQLFNSPEPNAHKMCLYGGVVTASLRVRMRAFVRKQFKHEYLLHQRAGRVQILSEASLGWGKGCIRF